MKMYLAKLALLCAAAGLVACQSPPRAASSGIPTALPQPQSLSETELPIVVVKQRPTVTDTRLLLEVQPPQSRLLVTSSLGQGAECTGLVERCLVNLVSHLKLGHWVE